MALDPETAARLAEYRQKILEDKYTDAELKDFIRITRAGRVTAAATSAKSRAKREDAQAEVDIDSIIDDIKAL